MDLPQNPSMKPSSRCLLTKQVRAAKSSAVRGSTCLVVGSYNGIANLMVGVAYSGIAEIYSN